MAGAEEDPERVVKEAPERSAIRYLPLSGKRWIHDRRERGGSPGSNDRGIASPWRSR